jgi:hypothetical protein
VEKEKEKTQTKKPTLPKTKNSSKEISPSNKLYIYKTKHSTQKTYPAYKHLK